jgi:hypothetical protein
VGTTCVHGISLGSEGICELCPLAIRKRKELKALFSLYPRGILFSRMKGPDAVKAMRLSRELQDLRSMPSKALTELRDMQQKFIREYEANWTLRPTKSTFQRLTLLQKTTR